MLVALMCSPLKFGDHWKEKRKVHVFFIEAERALIVKFPTRTGSAPLKFSVNK